jgi:four helix bundle protein
MSLKSFEELDVWKDSVHAAKHIYTITNQKLFSKDFGLRDQIQRAIVSVGANIVEGYERSSTNEFIRFLKIAKGSAGEVRAHLYIAKEIGYIDDGTFTSLRDEMVRLSKRIGAFITYLGKFRST